ncbi:hypothetical protein [Paenibacillus sp. NEAU-GSW1]|uniref:hypothetical protein n=1 Tax=Paenibacillus sp. NEAU-GSW1 TaxID=2682486 RepID=UPI0012E0FCE5|nr:hypothetical protein [Paenibacillus sp. NEAU-GSW1]MUT65219.1 hypothetical protein [Paenibacillus sp. NEAU-GSW1]
MTAAFYRMGWGIIFTMLDFRFGYFDLLPDVIGYALLWSAIHVLEARRKEYGRAKPFAILLTIASASELLPLWQGTISLTSNTTNVSIPSFVYGGAVMLLLLLLFHFFLTAMERHAKECRKHSFAAAIAGRRLFFNLTSGALLVMMPFLLNFSPTLRLWLVFVTLLSLIAMLAIFFACRRAGKELRTPSQKRPLAAGEEDTEADSESDFEDSEGEQ